MSAILNNIEIFLEDGFVYAVLAMGYFISYTTLDFPDLTVEGTVVSGAVSFSLLVKQGVNPWVAMLLAFFVGGICGAMTGLLHVKLNIRPLLCGILMSTALMSVNIVITVVGMGGNWNGEGGLTTIPLGRRVPTILRTWPANILTTDFYGINISKLVTFFLVAVNVKLVLDLYLKTKNGLMLRAAGNNEQYVSMMAQNPGNYKILGLAIGNGLAALTGALLAQGRGNANQTMGLGMIVIGIASVIIGTSLFARIRFLKATTKVIIGAIIYQACLGIAVMLGVPSAYNKLIMAVLFTIALLLSGNAKKSV